MILGLAADYFQPLGTACVWMVIRGRRTVKAGNFGRWRSVAGKNQQPSVSLPVIPGRPTANDYRPKTNDC